MSTRIGDLTERVWIRAFATPQARNNFNEKIRTAERVCRRWAKVTNISSARRGGEGPDPAQMETHPFYEVVIRPYDDITTKHQIEWAGTVLEIMTIADDGEYTMLICQGTI